MERFKKFLAILITLSLSLSLISPALASHNQEENSVCSLNITEQILAEHENYVLSLRAEDLSNGDARFSMIENGQIVSCSYVNRAEGKILYTQYKNGVEILTKEKIIPHILQAQTEQLQPTDDIFPNYIISRKPIDESGFVYVGKVGYAHYVQGMIMCTNYINWAYCTIDIPISSCNLNGFYQDLANFAALIAGLLGVAASFKIIEIADYAVKALGIVSVTSPFVIPDYPVSCFKTEVTWRAYLTNGSGTLYTGSRCTVTHPDHKGQTVYVDDYYPITAIANHNYSLALAPYTRFFPGSDNYEIVSWPT